MSPTLPWWGHLAPYLFLQLHPYILHVKTHFFFTRLKLLERVIQQHQSHMNEFMLFDIIIIIIIININIRGKEKKMSEKVVQGRKQWFCGPGVELRKA